MKGAFRNAALAVGIALCASVALAQPSSDTATSTSTTTTGDRAQAKSEVTDRDRMWANFTREAAVVGDGHFWIEIQAMKLNDDSQIDQPDVTDPTKTIRAPTLGLNGYPVKPFAEKKGSNVKSIDGGTFNLIGAYGIQDWEVGGNLPLLQQQISFATKRPEENFDIGDIVLYGKYKLALADNWAGGLGMEMSIPSGDEDELLGSGDLGLNPFVSTRYSYGPLAVGGHLGFLLNTGSQPQVFNWSVEGIARANQYFAMRVEFDGRLFNDVGSTFNDIAIYPGLDINFFDNVIIRPEGLVAASDDAINWGIGIGLVFTM
jgi:hypothetical protein